jgi:predicted ATPase/Tfp pilus assembly protein PilF
MGGNPSAPALVGRGAETARLGSALDAALEGRGSALFVTGEPGIGKTRLLEEFRGLAVARGARLLAGGAAADSAHPFLAFSRALAGELEAPLFSERESVSFSQAFAMDGSGALVAKASSGPGGDAGAFAGMLSTVQGFVGDSFGHGGAGLGRLEYGGSTIIVEHGKGLSVAAVFSGQEHGEMRAAVRAALARAAGGGDLQEALSSLAGMRFLAARDLEGAELERERLRIADRALQLLVDLSAKEPVALVLEDLHWADESTLFVLGHVARNTAGRRLLVLGACRRGESPAADGALSKIVADGAASELTLGRLGRGEVSEMVSAAFPGHGLPSSFVDALAERCGGNPLFVVELLRQMAADGSIALRSGRFSLLAEGLSIPDTVEGVIQGRIAGLSPEALALAEYASCIGREFEVSVALSASGVGDAAAALSELQGAGIVRRLDGGAEFCHAMYRDVINSSISGRWLSAHHRSIGEHLEKAYAGRTGEVLYELARHFSRTAEHAKAFGYCVGAGEKAEAAYAAEQAMRFYDSALEALRKGGAPTAEEGRIAERLGGLASLLGQYAEALGRYERALELSSSPEDRSRLLRKAGEVREKTGEYDEALESFAGAKALLPSGPERGRTCLAECSVHFLRGDYDKALPLLEEAAATFPPDCKEAADALRSRGLISWRRGEFDSAVSEFERALAIYEKLGELGGVAQTLADVGKTYGIKGDANRALPHFERSLELWRRIGDQKSLALAINNVGNVRAMLGEFDRALAAQKESLAIRERIGDRWGVASSLSNIGQTLLLLGDPAGALAYYERGLAAFVSLGDRHSIGALHNNVGTCHEMLGDREGALRSYSLGRDFRASVGDKDGLAQVLFNMGDVRCSMGDVAEAVALVTQSLSLALEIDNREEQAWALAKLSEINSSLGEHGKAQDLAAKALAAAQGTQMDRELGLARQAAGVALRGKGELDAALKEFSAAAAHFESGGARHQLAALHYEWGALDRLRGDNEGARAHFTTALSSFQQMGERLWAERCRKTLEELK